MKTSDQIYDEVEARWLEEKAERRRKLQSRAADVILLSVPWMLLCAWAISERQTIVISICPPLLVGSLSQLKQRWRLEDRIERLEKER